MEINNAQRALVLTEALPYIQKYAGKIVVIKYYNIFEAFFFYG